MAEQERKTVRREPPREEPSRPKATAVEKGKELRKNLDELLDEIDTVLERNAEEFVKSYVQRGGPMRKSRPRSRGAPGIELRVALGKEGCPLPPHGPEALALGPSAETSTVLVAVARARLARLRWELRDAGRKSACHFRPENRGAEYTAWRRALVRFAGSLRESMD